MLYANIPKSCRHLRLTIPEQRDFLLTLLEVLLDIGHEHCLQLFLTGVAGSEKTFTPNVVRETVNRFTQAQGCRNNAYVACAPTGKVAVAKLTTRHSELPYPEDLAPHFHVRLSSRIR